MPGIELVEPLRDPRWKKLVASKAHAWVCHMPSWKDVLEKTFPHIRGHYLAIGDEGTGELTAGLPLFEVRSFVTGRRLVSIPFATLSDPLAETRSELDLLLGEATALARRQNCSRIEIRTTETEDLFDDRRFVRTSEYVRHVLELDAPAEDLKKRFHRSCVRQPIQRGIKSDLEVFQADDERYLKSFERLHALTRQRLGLPPQPGRFFRSLFEHFAREGKLTLFVATLNDEVAGGLILLHHGHRASAEVIAEDFNLRKLSVTHLLFWEAIKYSCRRGYRAFDFGRTAIRNANLMAFKSRWGTRSIELPQFCFGVTAPCAPVSGRRGSSARACLGAVIKTSPLPIARLIGHCCYRHMG